jgi:hypothetical protein
MLNEVFQRQFVIAQEVLIDVVYFVILSQVQLSFVVRFHVDDILVRILPSIKRNYFLIKLKRSFNY